MYTDTLEIDKLTSLASRRKLATLNSHIDQQGLRLSAAPLKNINSSPSLYFVGFIALQSSRLRLVSLLSQAKHASQPVRL